MLYPGFMGIHGDSLVFVAEFRGFYEDSMRIYPDL